jgi:hypothetical protein
MPRSVSDEDLVTAMCNWVDDDAPETFDGTFINSMRDALEKYGSLTVAQRSALENIARGFKVDISLYKDN